MLFFSRKLTFTQYLEVNRMENKEKPVVNITVNVTGVQEATQLVECLCEKIKEAKTLAGDLTSLLESLEVDVHS